MIDTYGQFGRAQHVIETEENANIAFVEYRVLQRTYKSYRLTIRYRNPRLEVS